MNADIAAWGRAQEIKGSIGTELKRQAKEPYLPKRSVQDVLVAPKAKDRPTSPKAKGRPPIAPPWDFSWGEDIWASVRDQSEILEGYKEVVEPPYGDRARSEAPKRERSRSVPRTLTKSASSVLRRPGQDASVSNYQDAETTELAEKGLSRVPSSTVVLDRHAKGSQADLHEYTERKKGPDRQSISPAN